MSFPVPIPSRDQALAWLSAQGVKQPQRWLSYAGGAPLRALAISSEAENIDRLLKAIAGRAEILIDDRESLEAYADALQKLALDRALGAFGLPAKYGAGEGKRGSGNAKAWLDFARWMGENRALVRHPLNTRLFAAEMLATMPRDEKS